MSSPKARMPLGSRFGVSSSQRMLRSEPVTPMRSALRTTTCSTPTFSSPKRGRTVCFAANRPNLKWKKELITEFNLDAPRPFDYKMSYVRTPQELSSKQDNMSSADFWPRRQKLELIRRFKLGPLLRKKLARSPVYELRLLARLSQPASPFQMDRRTSLLITDHKTVRDIKLMNNNEDPWMYSRPIPVLASSQKPSMDEWANHPIYRPASAAEIRTRKQLNGDRQTTLDAFIKAVEIEEHKAAMSSRGL